MILWPNVLYVNSKFSVEDTQSANLTSIVRYCVTFFVFKFSLNICIMIFYCCCIISNHYSNVKTLIWGSCFVYYARLLMCLVTCCIFIVFTIFELYDVSGAIFLLSYHGLINFKLPNMWRALCRDFNGFKKEKLKYLSWFYENKVI